MVYCSNNSNHPCTRNPRREELLVLVVTVVLFRVDPTHNPFVHAQSNLGRVNMEQGVIILRLQQTSSPM